VFIGGLVLLGLSFLWIVAAFVLSWDQQLDQPRSDLNETQVVTRKVQLQARFQLVWRYRGAALGCVVLGLVLMVIGHPQ
jgi:hypothetical protein